MRLFTLLCWALTAEAAVLKHSSQVKRQAGFFFPVGAAIAKKTPLEPVLSKDLDAQIFTQASRKRMTWGPIRMEAVQDPHNKGEGGIKLDQHSDLFEEALAGFCKDCMLLNAHLDVTDETGKKLGPKDSVYTHHIILGAFGNLSSTTPITPTSVCPGGSGSFLPLGAPLGGFPSGQSFPGGLPSGLPSGFPSGLPSGFPSGFPGLPSGLPFPSGAALPTGLPLPGGFLGAAGGFPGAAGLSQFLSSSTTFVVKGQEENAINFTPIDQINPKSGVWIGSNTTIMTSVEVVNYKKNPWNVYFTVDVEYLNFPERPKDYLRSDFAALFGMDCNGNGMGPPKDKLVTYESPEYNVDRQIYLVNMNPHLHDGALNMKFLVNGTVVCNAEAFYGKEGGLSINGKEWETIKSYSACETVKLNPGDKIKISADYDLRQHELRPDSEHHDMGTDSMAIAFVQFSS